MRSNAFREQVTTLLSWFKNWSECEQTVAIYSLLKRSSPVQAKFLQQVLQHFLSDCTDLKELEENANDEEYVRNLHTKEKNVLHQLLQLFPLLKVGQDSAKAAYLELIPDHLSHTIFNGINVEESRQLISFSLIHPALSAEERVPLHRWLGYLDDRLTYGNIQQQQQNVGGISSSGNCLTVNSGGGSSSSSSSSGGSSNNPSHSPSPISPSHRSISQSSLCQDAANNQDYNNQIIPASHANNPHMLSPHILSKQSHPPSPIGNTNTWLQQQQLPQQHNYNTNQIQGPLSSSSGVEVNTNTITGPNFNNAPPGNFSNSGLTVGSTGNNICYSPSSISSGQRSFSQASLTQDSSSQDQIQQQIVSSGMRPISGGHSPVPSINQWQQQQQQPPQSNQHKQLYHQQQSLQGNQSNQAILQPSPAQINPSSSSSNSNASSRYNQYSAFSGNSHRTLRASNSHNVGTFEGSTRGHMPLKATASAPPNFSLSQPPSSKFQDKSSYSSSSPSGQRYHARLSRTRSLVPAARWQKDQLQQQNSYNACSSGSSASLWWRQDSNKSATGSVVGGSGSNVTTTEHAPLSPQSSVTSSESSDSHHEDGPPASNEEYQEPAIPNLICWLKEIRLHKYAYLFRNMTYEELLNLSEDWLLQNNVVRGARQRFMTNIEKLNGRQSLLKVLEKSVTARTFIQMALMELEDIMDSPIVPYKPEKQQQKQEQQQQQQSTVSTDLIDSTSITSTTTTTTTPTTDSSSKNTTTPTPTPSDNTSDSITPSSSSTLATSSSTNTSSSSSSSPPTTDAGDSDGIAEGDLPSQICRLLTKVCQQLLRQELLRKSTTGQDFFRQYLKIVKAVLRNDSFTAEQKKSLENQTNTAKKIWGPVSQEYKHNSSYFSRRGDQSYSHSSNIYDSFGSRMIPRSNRTPVPSSHQQKELHWRQQQQQQQYRQQQQQQQQQQHYNSGWNSYHQQHQYQQQQQQQWYGGAGQHQSWSSSGGGAGSSLSSSSRGGGGGSSSMGGHQSVTRNISWNPAYLNNKPGLMEPPAKQPLSRTQSAPNNRPMTLPTRGPSGGGVDDIINASLDSLCVQMTEQALGNEQRTTTMNDGSSGFSRI